MRFQALQNRVFDPARIGELIDAHEHAAAALDRARADIDAEITALRAQYAAADPAGKAALASGLQQLELRVRRWTRDAR
jgi:hypothetical protein